MKMEQPFSLAAGLFIVHERNIMRIFLPTFVLLLSSCGPGPNDLGPGGVSMEDSRTLDKAAQTLDAQTILPVVQPTNQSVTTNKK
jgi:starvation-inducible outer membrane lipoprotein